MSDNKEYFTRYEIDLEKKRVVKASKIFDPDYYEPLQVNFIVT